MNPHDVLRYADRTFRRAIDALDPADWTRVVAGVWTPKDVVGHVSAIHLLSVSALADFAGEPAPPAEQGLADDVDFNMSQAAIRAPWPVERVVAEYDGTQANLRRLAVAARGQHDPGPPRGGSCCDRERAGARHGGRAD